MRIKKNLFFVLLILMNIQATLSVSAGELLTDKTLVVWARPTDMTFRGGTALTIDMANPDAFDAIVFAELEPNVWMPGSSGWKRTKNEQSAWPKEQSGSEFVRLATVYRGKTIEFYRNDTLVASYQMDGSPQTFDNSATILFGPRHMEHMTDIFVGRIQEARIYAVALNAQQIAALKPGQTLPDTALWAEWNFADNGLNEKTGRFDDLRLTGDAKIENGSLVLGAKGGALIARNSKFSFTPDAQIRTKQSAFWNVNDPVPTFVLESARTLREKFLADPYRPQWHFTVPEDNGMPGDPNGCFYANGRFHLMYLYNRAGSGFCWGHLSSIDLVHWRHCPDAIGPGNGDDGCFSGGAFLDDDGTAYITYWILGKNTGIGIAKSRPPYDQWTKLPENPVVRSVDFGISEIQTDKGKVVYGSSDPSNIWKKDGLYYMLTGNLPVLNKYGRGKDSPEDQKGDRLYLLESKNFKQWHYNGVFYQRRNEWTDVSEDNMCPSFLPLPSSPDGGKPSGKYLLLFISHNKGCQYYTGTYDTQKNRFLPEKHGRMTQTDNTFFAPEALIDGRGRQIFWAWLLDNREGEISGGWSGVYGLPRTLWIDSNNTLRMKPVPELESLRINEKKLENISLVQQKNFLLTGCPGDSCEIELTVSPEELVKVKKFGTVVRQDPKNGEETFVYYDAEAKALMFDSRKSGKAGRPALESLPLSIPKGEPLTLRVFIDRSVIEVYANDRQAICRRVYPSDPKNAVNIAIRSEGQPIVIQRVRSWEMAPANPY